MPLALEPRSADFIPYVKFNGKAGRWFTKTDVGDEIEVATLTAVFDLAHIKTGWILFAEQSAPDAVWDHDGVKPAQPSDKHKRGFSVNLYSKQSLGGVREFSANSNTAITAITELYDQYENAPEAKRGMLPVVKCEAALPVKSKFGVNYQPVFVITKWIARPEELVAATKLNGSTSTAPQTARPTEVPPPITARQPAPAARQPEPVAAAAEEAEEF